jgi:hypothetical protein
MLLAFWFTEVGIEFLQRELPLLNVCRFAGSVAQRAHWKVVAVSQRLQAACLNQCKHSSDLIISTGEDILMMMLQMRPE